jgi:beta-N-acetylhexosaminidase
MTSLEGLALRCLMPGFEGVAAPDWVRRKVSMGLGAVALYARNVENREQLAALSSRLHAERPELLIATDEEGGNVTRLEARTGSSYPGNYALGVAGDPELTLNVAAAMGNQLTAAGIDLDLAPVADVNSNPNNPVIGVRSFGSDSESVALHTAAWVAGMQQQGVAACAKHFPGHGDTSVDSHLALPFVHEDPHVLALAPFQAAIASGVQAIMSAHIVVTALDEVPATVSPRIMRGLLREEMSFTGLAITDGLEMRGLSDGLGVPEGAVRALIAGCDALCIGGGLADEQTVDDVVAAITEAVRDGRLPEARLAEAAGRVDALAAWRALQGRPALAEDGVGLLAARRAIRSDGPVHVGQEAVVMRFDAPVSIAAGIMPWGVAASLAARGVRLIESDDPVAGASLVLVVRDLHRRDATAQTVESILARRPDAVVVEMGLPVCRPQNARAYIATGGASRASAEAAAEVMRP